MNSNIDHKKQKLKLKDQELEYLLLNQEQQNKPTLIFLHEGLGCIEMWKDFPFQLCQATGLPGLVYSRVGYGGSSALNGPRAVDFMHDEAQNTLAGILNHLGIEQAILVGHSDGASIALIYAGATEDPRLTGLILLAPHLFVEAETIQGIQAARDNYLNGNLKRQLTRYHGLNVEGAFWGWNNIWLLPDFLHWNIQEFIPNIKVPTLAIQGIQDQYGTIEQLNALKSDLQVPFEQCLIPECGHSPHMEKRDHTLSVITQYISKQRITNKDPLG